MKYIIILIIGFIFGVRFGVQYFQFVCEKVKEYGSAEAYYEKLKKGEK